jgi:WD40 repeat protein
MGASARLWDHGTLQEDVHETTSGSCICVGFLGAAEPVYLCRLASGDLQVSSVKTQHAVATLSGMKEVIECITASAGLAYVACGYHDGKIAVWDIHNETPIASLDANSLNYPTDVSPNTSILRAFQSLNALSEATHTVMSKEQSISDYMRAFTEMAELSRHIEDTKKMLSGGSVTSGPQIHAQSIAITDDGKYLGWASNRGTLHIYDIANSVEAARFEIQDSIARLQFSRNGQRVFCGGVRGIWAMDVDSSKILYYPREDGMQSITCMDMSPDESVIACGHRDGKVSLVDTRSGDTLCEYRNNVFAIECITVSPDSRWVAFASEGTDVCVMEVDVMGSLAPKTKGHTDQITCVSVYSDGSRYVTGSMDGTIRVWQSDTARELSVMKGPHSIVSHVWFIRDGAFLISISDDRTIRIWDAKRGREVLPSMGHKSMVTCLDVCESSSNVVSGCHDGTIHIWDMRSGELRTKFMAHDEGVEYVSVSADGKALLSGGYDFAVRLWDISSRPIIEVSMARDNESFGVPRPRFIGKSKRCACWFGDDTIRVLDMDRVRELACIELDYPIMQYTVTGDGRLIIVECEDHEISVRSASSGKELRRFKGYFWTEGDIWAVRQGIRRWPWRAVPHGDDVCIEYVPTHKKMAWIHKRMLSVVPKRPIWIATDGAFLHSYTLEDFKGQGR